MLYLLMHVSLFMLVSAQKCYCGVQILLNPLCFIAVCAAPPTSYALKSNLNWQGTSETYEGAQTSAAEAEKICNSNFNCLAWNNWGYYILKKTASSSPSLTFFEYGGLCVYVKDHGKYDMECPCTPSSLSRKMPCILPGQISCMPCVSLLFVWSA